MLMPNEIARSILDSFFLLSKTPMRSDELMQEMLEITAKHLKIDMLSFFLFSESGETAWLHASTGEIGKKLVARGHKIALRSSPLLLMPVIDGEIRINDGWSGNVYGCLIPAVFEPGAKLPFLLLQEVKIMHSENAPSTISFQLPAPRWEIALPLRVPGHVFGALAIQILEFSRFTLDDCPNLQWVADQISTIYTKSN
jgi:hypothetical protein